MLLVPLVLLTGHTIVNALLLRRPPRDAVTERRVAVLLPLRDEADRVTPCLEALLSQRGVPRLEIVVLDDGSADGTADVVRSVAARSAAGGPVAADPPAGESVAADPAAGESVAGGKVRLLTGATPPDGWLGKPHACAQLAAAVPEAEVLVFVDADVVLAPDAVAGGVVAAEGFELLSPYPRIVGFGRLVQPLLQWSWLTFLPMRAMERSPRTSLAAAGGQWLVVSRGGYDRAGGHAAVRGEVLEDIALARAVKRSGGRIALADGSALATCRMYDSWPALVDGYTKSLWASFPSAFGAASVVVLLLLLYAVPPLFVPTPWWPLAVTAYLLGVAGRAVTARATGGRAFPDALAHPASIVVFAYLIALSYQRRRRGALTWRGRPV
ncbi:glycosyltransferase family 2 protein [Actinoplanes sp. NBRC 103695]|uniref:glycosyltransferase n=1 Tax=Actinoplanes sp. NBRC 103695 TaxID=3032202 RepID=UPI002556C8E8|nr:glycosyltransferase family 2 protein [Actinoplanes sp. NBRC 103695]